MASASDKRTLVFHGAKKELFTASSGYKQLAKKLRSSWKVTTLKDELTPERLEGTDVLAFGGPRQKFTTSEIDMIRGYMDGGGSVLVMIGEGGEARFDTNLNFLLEEYGVVVNSDSVVRSSYYKYHHPKECMVSNGVLNRELNRAAGKFVPGSREEVEDTSGLKYLYPFGATLTVQPPAIPVLSTGSVSIPLNRPTCAFHSSSVRPGKLVVLGSCHIFSDNYLDKEENLKLLEVILTWLTTNDIVLDQIDADEPEVSEYSQIPHTAKLAGSITVEQKRGCLCTSLCGLEHAIGYVCVCFCGLSRGCCPCLSFEKHISCKTRLFVFEPDKPRVCLQESEPVPRDFTQLFTGDMFAISTKHIPEVTRAFDELEVKHEQLSLIRPQFETPLPPLQPAVFAPTFMELEPPALDLFDLDACFSSQQVRLNQLTNKCNDDDLEYFVRECGEIMGITHRIDPAKRDGKHILAFALSQLIEFKKSISE
eukprot:m.48675 g.48675  ORF g.48675 m.48675 type:complete len:480 (-) comp11053_c0_seq1:205-1644(-)